MGRWLCTARLQSEQAGPLKTMDSISRCVRSTFLPSAKGKGSCTQLAVRWAVRQSSVLWKHCMLFTVSSSLQLCLKQGHIYWRDTYKCPMTCFVWMGTFLKRNFSTPPLPAMASMSHFTAARSPWTSFPLTTFKYLICQVLWESQRSGRTIYYKWQNMTLL